MQTIFWSFEKSNTEWFWRNTPRKIDDSGLQLNDNKGIVAATTGIKTVNCVRSADKGETGLVIILIVCVTAEGHFPPPVCIFTSKKKKQDFEDGLP